MANHNVSNMRKKIRKQINVAMGERSGSKMRRGGPRGEHMEAILR